MNKKLIFRILGALASALIIVAVFVPFVSVTGYSISIWETFKITNALYLPIMIILFGIIGVVFFSLNIKTEFAYMSTGAIIFFIVMQTIDIMNQGVFNTLSIGYYLLVLGAILTGLMAFLTNLKSKNVVKNDTPLNTEPKANVLSKIDDLYNNQNSTPIQPVEELQPIPNNQNSNSMLIFDTPNVQINEGVNNSNINGEILQQQNVASTINQQSFNPVVNEFTLEQPKQDIQVGQQLNEIPNAQVSNPVVNEFTVEQPKQDTQVGQQLNEIPNVQVSNPVVNEFTVTDTNNQLNTDINQNNPALKDLSPIQGGTGETDIFGQPINKSYE